MVLGDTVHVQIKRDGKVIKTTSRIDSKPLDKLFAALRYERRERKIGKIHYEKRR
jgi:hypothetical protein